MSYVTMRSNNPVYPRGFATPEGRHVPIKTMANALREIRKNPEASYPGWNWYPTEGHAIIRSFRRGLHDRINRRFDDRKKQQARIYAARIHRELAAEAMTANYYADHVTEADRADIAMRNMKLAEEIERGECNHNFTVAQRMHYYLTGESVPFLPPTEPH